MYNSFLLSITDQYVNGEGKLAHSPYYIASHEGEVSVQATHTDEEIIAQSICTSATGVRGWSYAVQRVCRSSNQEMCTEICESDALRSQDPQTAKRQWRASASLHVYKIDHHPLPVPLLTLTLASKFFSIKILIVRAVDLISAAAMCQCTDHVDNHHLSSDSYHSLCCLFQLIYSCS